jgi:hypothetical protein
MTAISVTIEKDDAGPYLRAVSDRAADFTEANRAVLESGMNDARETIRAGGPDFGWAPHHPFTTVVDRILGRARVGTLQEKGALLGSIGNVFNVTATEGEAGSNLANAKFQQEGTDRTFFFLQFVRTGEGKWGGRGITPRPFMWWHEQRFPEYDAIYLNHLMGEG